VEYVFVDFSSFHTMPTCDGQPDRQTDRPIAVSTSRVLFMIECGRAILLHVEQHRFLIMVWFWGQINVLPFYCCV